MSSTVATHCGEAARHHFALFTRELAAERARFALVQGDLAAAGHERGERAPLGMLREFEQLTLARVRSAEGHGEAALALLSGLLR
jgi:hypothetical protein